MRGLGVVRAVMSPSAVPVILLATGCWRLERHPRRWLAGAVFGIDGAAGILAMMLGLGGLMAGVIRAAAITRAADYRDDA